MRRAGALWSTVFVFWVVWTAPAAALVIGGGGSSRTDCILALDGPFNYPPSNPKGFRCTDGDPTCDADGVVNGVCQFPIGVCANSTYRPDRCTSLGVDEIVVEHAQDNGDPKFDTSFQSLQNRIDSIVEPPTSSADRCSGPANIFVRVQGPFPGDVCKRAKKKLRITTTTPLVMGQLKKDVDTVNLVCDPPAGACDPTVLFSGTYDRIQRQVFNQSCAVSGCHDSQTQQAGLLLESGAALGNLVNVNPFNPVARNLGWKRLVPGDSSTSLIIHKITGDLEPGMDARMPRGRPKLDNFLIDIMTLWVDAGAPATGWVPGTD
jgi:hypothetical protein